MGAARTAFARANARAGVLASIAAVVLLLSGLSTAVIDSLAGSSASGLRSSLAAAQGTAGAARWQIRIAQDPEAQADAAASVLDRMVSPFDASWSRSVETAPVDATSGDTAFGAVLLADPGAAERSELVDGSWPEEPEAIAAAEAEGAVPATLHAAAAEALDLAPGDLVDLEGGSARRLLVVGTWLPLEPSDPAWFGEGIVASGTTADGAGPFLVAEGSALDLPAAIVVRWTAVVDASVTPDSARLLRSELPDVEPALRAEPAIGTDGLSALGGLEATLSRLLASLGAVRAIAPLPILLLAFTGIAALTRLATLLGAARRGETVLLRARGASAARLARDTAVEVLVLGVPAAVLGAAGAQAVLMAARPGETRDPGTAAVVASVVVVVALLVVAGRAWLDARRPVVRGAGDEVGRVARGLATGGGVLLVVLAAVALWQFRLYGSPLVASASGAMEVDPIAVLAPMLVLVALALAALWLTRPIDAVLERLAAARPGLVPALPMRQLARRASLYAAASLVTMLAVAGLTLSAAFSGAWQGIDRTASALATGGEVRVSYAGRDVVQGPDPLALDNGLAGAEGISAEGPVFRGEVRIGSDQATVVALPAGGTARIAPGTGAARVAAELEASADAAGAAMPAGTTALDVAVALDAPAGTGGTVAVTAWFITEDGAATSTDPVSVEVAADGGPVSLAVPDADGLRFIGLGASLSGASGAEVLVSFGAISLDGTTVAGAEFEIEPEHLLTSKAPNARATLTTGGSDPLPVVLSADLAERMSAEIGDRFAFRVLTGSAEIDAVVAGLLPVVPTAGDDGMLADLAAFERYTFDSGAGVPAFGERWIATTEPDQLAADLDREHGSTVIADARSASSSAPFIAPAIAALWVGAAGALLFALISVVALVAALGGSRLGEVVVLRALGVPARTQSRARFAELAVTLGTAVVIGTLVGFATAVLTARELARAAVAAVPAVVPVEFGVDAAPWLIGIAAFLLLATAIAAGAAASVRRVASRPGLRQEEG
ncbi:hypothetical protein [Agromyces cerinus]|uniref:ABC-type transport system, involved in lipoprotein release, permease component n=1 Tax=Agromyces cerinus subsp. cerinus TaxID=232089 RepID=A0A1N6FHQ2_9MICO|nr:hypothetical protein [Agromyces cerinus]SIN94782.1 ABC-type transport system, involved in lipoprotein release, permease component [Agromyces cerinus subsp. cerinus]